MKYFYIMKRGLYYCPNFCGYTSFKSEAGIYSEEEAKREATLEGISIIPINVKLHNEMIQKRINSLTKHLIHKPVEKKNAYSVFDVWDVFRSKQQHEYFDLFLEALDIMEQSNTRSKVDCIALAMGFKYHPTKDDFYIKND